MNQCNAFGKVVKYKGILKMKSRVIEQMLVTCLNMQWTADTQGAGIGLGIEKIIKVK